MSDSSAFLITTHHMNISCTILDCTNKPDFVHAIVTAWQ